MHYAKCKTEDGFSFTAVRNWLFEHASETTNQARIISKQDVANVAQKWRKANSTLEMKTVVDEPTPEEAVKKRCLSLVDSSTRQGLMSALPAVCRRMLEAHTIILPILQATQEQPADNGGESSGFTEGAEIEVPVPGLPERCRLGRPRSQYPWDETPDDEGEEEAHVPHALPTPSAPIEKPGLQWQELTMPGPEHRPNPPPSARNWNVAVAVPRVPSAAAVTTQPHYVSVSQHRPVGCQPRLLQHQPPAHAYAVSGSIGRGAVVPGPHQVSRHYHGLPGTHISPRQPGAHAQQHVKSSFAPAPYQSTMAHSAVARPPPPPPANVPGSSERPSWLHPLPEKSSNSANTETESLDNVAMQLKQELSSP